MVKINLHDLHDRVTERTIRTKREENNKNKMPFENSQEASWIGNLSLIFIEIENKK